MNVENLLSEPIKKTYKYGVYASFGFVGVFLALFIAWSLTCFGGACLQWLQSLV